MLQTEFALETDMRMAFGIKHESAPKAIPSPVNQPGNTKGLFIIVTDDWVSLRIEHEGISHTTLSAIVLPKIRCVDQIYQPVLAIKPGVFELPHGPNTVGDMRKSLRIKDHRIPLAWKGIPSVNRAGEPCSILKDGKTEISSTLQVPSHHGPAVCPNSN